MTPAEHYLLRLREREVAATERMALALEHVAATATRPTGALISPEDAADLDAWLER